MKFNSLSEFVSILESQKELVRISQPINPELEISEIVDRVSKTPEQNIALLFENTGTDFPVLINSLGNEERVKIALRVDNLDELGQDIKEIFDDISTPKAGIMDKLSMLPKLGKMASYMPKVTKKKGKCQEVVMDNPDLSKLPILKCWPLDGGPFVTLPAVHTKDPETGIRNIGMYRMQVYDDKTTGMHWHKHKVSARHFEQYKKLGKRMPVAVALGGDPVYTYAATAPLPDHIDEYILAGFLRKKKVELVPCLTQPEIEVPADADIIIEGYVDPNEEKSWEGPFGDHTGFYSLPDWYPNFHVTAITHKKDAIYPATIVGIPPQEDAWIGKATERIFLNPIKLTVIPEIEDMHMPVEGVFHNLVIAKIDKTYAGQAMKVMNAMWGAGQMMFNKILVVVDGDVDLEDYQAVAKKLFENMDPSLDAHTSMGPMDVLDHSCSSLGFGGKMCLDGTHKFEEESMGRSDFRYLQKDQLSEFSQKVAQIKGVAQVNDSLIAQDISCLIIGVDKTEKNQVRQIHEQICALTEELPKMILYIDQTENIMNLSDVLWFWSNGVDPAKDKTLIKNCLGMDGTRKTKELDDFHRDWPNVIIADPATIEKIDSVWESLGIGIFIPSPSLKYIKDFIGKDAEAYHNAEPKNPIA